MDVAFNLQVGICIPYILKYSILSPKVTKSSLFCSTQVCLYIVRYTIGYQDDKRSNIQQASLWIADREGGGQSNLICMHVVLLLFSYLVYALLYVVLHYNIVEHNIHIQQRTVHSITSNTDVQSPMQYACIQLLSSMQVDDTRLPFLLKYLSVENFHIMQVKIPSKVIIKITSSSKFY